MQSARKISADANGVALVDQNKSEWKGQQTDNSVAHNWNVF